jgi:hypothetical protein
MFHYQRFTVRIEFVWHFNRSLNYQEARKLGIQETASKELAIGAKPLSTPAEKYKYTGGVAGGKWLGRSLEIRS